ncbi:aromatic motif membrane protein [Mycoplasma hafezii]|uniref:aromatic motif membrane protein n=1 Tax=Mycoplasma hafezii TaxID=525886 RepID=UPI003CEDE7C0
MKNKKKWMLLSFLPLMSFTALSCANYQNVQKMEKYIDHKFDHIDIKEVNEQKHNEALLNQILKLVFKNDETAKTAFLNSQTEANVLPSFQEIYQANQETFETKSKLDQEIAQLNEDLRKYEFLPQNFAKELEETREKIKVANQQLSSLTDKISAYNDQIMQWASKNWYFFLMHLDLFKFNYLEFIGETFKNLDFIDKNYLNKFKNLLPPNPYRVTDDLLGNMVVGSESSELANSTVYYLSKDKLVFRIMIKNISNNNTYVEISDNIWYFPNLKAPEISLNLISSIYHYAFIHGVPAAYEQFITDMVKKQRYGEPVYVYPTLLKE